MLSTLDRRVVLISVLIFLVAGSFWTGSRYPNLSEKAVMGGNTQLESLGFDTVIEIGPDASTIEQIAFTTVNWLDTNKRGMTFGIILAACLMTLMSILRRRSFSNPFANSLAGAIVGAPLGVCVNCAAPIARGLHAAGARLETSLSTMISSPTLNIIVLTILFSLFPLYVALTKIAFTLAFILLGIPILTKILLRLNLLRSDVVAPDPNNVCGIPSQLSGAGEFQAPGQWLDSLTWTGTNLVKNLWFLVKTTVPLMLLAGLLGAATIVLIPWDTVTAWLSAAPGGAPAKLSLMFGIALLGVFLPVPMAFDVIIVAVLVTAGLPVDYAMVLLFTLGIFSVYSFSIIWTSMSRIVAVAFFIGLAGLGVVTGVAVNFLSGWQEGLQREQLYRALLAEVDTVVHRG